MRHAMLGLLVRLRVVYYPDRKGIDNDGTQRATE